MDELEFALLNIGGTSFEEFSMDYLRAQGYEVHESGSQGRDGGWDARIELGDQKGIAHASKRKDWRVKLRDDAEKVEELEEERDEDYDIFVFLTNRHVSGEQELEIESEIKEEYGWNLILHHQTRILGELRQNHTELADRHLGVDLGGGPEYLDELITLREERLDKIRDRAEEAADLDEGPTVALHVIPNSVFSNDKIRLNDLSPPLVIGDTIIGVTETRGKMRYTSESMGDGYAFIRNDGLFETATTGMFREGHEEDELWINGIVDRRRIGLDGGVILTLRQALESLSEAGLSGVASVSLSLLNAENAKLYYEDGIKRPYESQTTFGETRYSTELVTVDIGDTEIIQDVEPMLSEVWRQFGKEGGTINIDEGVWQRGKIDVSVGDLNPGDK
ncbi:restriction endonuclease [Halorubrum ezzemoulense]|uniref:restriction endonuclease n=1 Tax=Halorubrum ezzemoulense TaxID=337243 RepID=UPI00233127F5|nr:restriction endonuclease [Halorubrum ezzemoulense]MDB9250056.1 restriction endonuclease [Halorubrum ezzemoulense]MDB9260081.1 restriction endonuclease [Halorubrum ezzemoulense]MDB9264383.1 restriction endonuclease [Halorubrum ezzemoulense]MDB9267101.1 restriction endonuclease [Halorubrum ezzemoulense]MDB9270442.1 restriction endonuclease [Halorubrum ezzemoulense]